MSRNAEVRATKPFPPTHTPDSSGRQLPRGVLPDTFCHTVGVRIPQKHLGVDKATGNGKKIKRQYRLRSCPKAGRGSKTQAEVSNWYQQKEALALKMPTRVKDAGRRMP